MLEHKEIFDIVKDRKEVAKSDYISIDDMAKKFNIDMSNL